MEQPESHSPTPSPATGSEDSVATASGAVPSENDLPGPTVVGIGASAGGLTALKTFFHHVPEDSGLAFVVVVHLSSEHESHLAELLQPHVKMPVQQVNETVQLEVNRVYVIPPGANLDSIDTHLRLSELEALRAERAPIDHFFRTLAKTHDGHAVAVVLTGTGSDGALGVKEVKERGGLTVVQDPNEADYDGMPQAALATGLVDLILPLAEIPEAILRFARTQPHVLVPEEAAQDEQHFLQQIFAHIRARTGRDFGRYKQSTILRRITRRMQLAHVEEPRDYLEILQERPEEVSALADDLLIVVTSFFRDPEAFEVLETEVMPRLFEGKGPDDSVRVWSVGCATGEEAYSLAILLLEQAARLGAPEEGDAGQGTEPPRLLPKLQIFASDLHEPSLAKAREGFYPGDIEGDVTPERLERFFKKENGGYRVKHEVRELVVFAPHNVLADPPFSRIDLVVCRNLFIYLQREVQRDVVSLFHYALKPGGFLLLGPSESVDTDDLFRVVDKEHHVYRRRSGTRREPRLPVFPLAQLRTATALDQPAQTRELAAYGALHQRMLERYGPPSVLVSPDDEVVRLTEQASRYLTQPGGEPTLNVFKYIRKELRLDLRSMLGAARKDGVTVVSQPISVPFDRHPSQVVLHVRPVLEPEYQGFAFVLFEERPPAGRWDTLTGAEGTDERVSYDRVRALEAELDRLQQHLQAIVEEHDASREEMKASNEELQSANEELRSTMEELETSKEELQSMNEELQTVNQENRHKVEELAQLSADLQNLMAATDIATLFLDRDLRILRFTPKAGELFNVRATDRGRPLSDITHRLGYDGLLADARAVLDALVPVEREVQDESGAWYLTRLLPYRSTEDRIGGIVLSFIEITERKQAEEALRKEKTYAESIVATLHEPLLVLTPDLRVHSANPAFFEHFGMRREETEGRLIYELANGQWNIPALRNLLESVLPENHVFDDFEVRRVFEHLGERVLLVNARRLDHVQFVLLGIRDVTEERRTEDTVRESEMRFRSLFNESRDVILLADDEGIYLDANPAATDLLGYEHDEIVGLSIADLSGVDESAFRAAWETFKREGRMQGEYELRTKGGASLFVEFSAVANVLPGEHMSTLRNITERKRVDEALRASERRVRELARAITLAEQRERQRIAYVLHEDLQQRLVAARMVGALQADEVPSPERVAELQRMLNEAVEISRTLSHELSPPIVQGTGLDDLLQWVAEQKRKEYGLNVRVKVRDAVRVSDEAVRVLFYQFLQELLFNVVKHAGTNEVRLTGEQINGEVRVHVEDAGAGFDVDAIEHSMPTGLGLPSIRERLELIGGRLLVESAPGEGTRVTVAIPMDLPVGEDTP